MNFLFQRSIEIIRDNQSPSGAYIACPTFATYDYSWFRDGSFIAYAMDLVGEHSSAARFHDWAARAINARSQVIHSAVARARAGEPLTGADILHTRYTLEGEDVTAEEWPNFQLDGFGTWLWALGEHLRLSGSHLPEAWAQAAGRVAAYLAALWALPCFDCWEEFPDRVHPHTLAAIYGGLQAHSRFSGQDHGAVLADIAGYLMDEAVRDGSFVKFIGSTQVDASLLSLSTPYRVVDPGDPRMRETVRRIETDLVRGGGVHRYSADTYYGGGEWLLLAAWLGWYYAEAGQPGRARELLTWIESQAGPDGELPEQVAATMNDPDFVEPWVQRWGSSASPLLWSHAMYLILVEKLNSSG